MDVDEALYAVENLGPDHLPDAAHVLAAEVRRLHTWDGLMSLLDEHYPADVMTGESRDLGPRIVRLTRELDAIRRRAERIIWLADNSPRYGKGRGQAAREILGGT